MNKQIKIGKEVKINGEWFAVLYVDKAKGAWYGVTAECLDDVEFTVADVVQDVR